MCWTRARRPRIGWSGCAGYRWRVFDWSSDDQRLLRRPRAAARQRRGPSVGGARSSSSPRWTAARSPPLQPRTRKRPARPTASSSPGPPRSCAHARRVLRPMATASCCSDAARQPRRRIFASSSTSSPPAVRRAVSSIRRATSNSSTQPRWSLSRLHRQRGRHQPADADRSAAQARSDRAALPAGIISSLKFDPSGKRLALTLESVALTARCLRVRTRDPGC